MLKYAILAGSCLSQVVNAWDTYAVRSPANMQLLDFAADLWEDARLDEVEEWLSQHLRNRSSERRTNVWAAQL